ncbi:alpha-N-acetylglucosaminidase [Streptomyces monticola]|uniref:Alpha-N-acetylglucosaminidase n=1 Tax=Streptomyces monticola TaxID=2666263 RepID=A0ABW2JCG0_9ACTN
MPPLGRRTFLSAAVAGSAVLGLGGCAGDAASGAPPQGPGPDTGAAAAAARRLLPHHWRQLTFRTHPRGGAGGAHSPADTFTVSGEPGRITIEGTTPAVQLRGLYWYLKHETHANITWAGSCTDALPARLPAPRRTVTRHADVPHRFALNDTNDGYTGPYRDWTYWEHELDVLALHGYNEVFVSVGADALYHRLFQEFGYGERELRGWIPAPAHQPWWLLQNMSGTPGSPHPVPAGVLRARAALGRRIADRLRALGMTPVLPGCFGTVPPGFADRNPGARVVPQGDWMGLRRPDWLDPRGPHFERVAAAFYRVQEEMFGPSSMYKMDLLHEGGSPGDVPVGAAARAVEKALRTARPDAVWAILGWRHNPPRAIVDAVDKSRMLVLDGLSDRFTKVTDREADWGGTPYAFGSIWNFGGHSALGANTPDWASLYEKWRTKPGSALRGIALLPEAADNNPAAFELFSELAWSEGPGERGDLDGWFKAWSRSRYGGRDRRAEAAWDTLRRTVYGTTRADEWSEGADGLFGARPDLVVRSAASWSPRQLRYTPEEFEPALAHLLEVAPGLRTSTAYRRDLLDVARQCLSQRSRVLLPQIKKAFAGAERDRFGTLTATWLDLMDLLDRLAATDSTQLLGRWRQEAMTWGASDAERGRLAYDATSLLTVWGTRAGADEGLRDYANREWAGLVGGLYRLRWQTYFDELTAALTQGRPPRSIDWFALENTWTRSPGRLLTAPQGDVYEVALEVREALRHTA